MNKRLIIGLTAIILFGIFLTTAVYLHTIDHVIYRINHPQPPPLPSSYICNPGEKAQGLYTCIRPPGYASLWPIFLGLGLISLGIGIYEFIRKSLLKALKTIARPLKPVVSFLIKFLKPVID
ncbi:hypothetical protein [Acidianus sp. HS-5]|uniref:hypothetical protein n=1 Tax=Acidianus sp. HS-5 TaxID=2886040 RepID=UPI001F305758|nr:hypothetical protein [Acidianus sp. HS-5]